MSEFLINCADSSTEEEQIPENTISLSQASNSNTKSQFTIEFKLKAVEFLESLHNNKYAASKNSKAALGRYVSRQNYYLWSQQKQSLLLLKNDRSVSIIRKRKMRSDRGSTNAKFPEIDEITIEKIKRHRAMGLQVNDEDIFKFGIEARDELNKNRDEEDKIKFTASNGWRYRLKQRHDLVLRAATTIGQKIPENAKDLALSFFEFIDEWVNKNTNNRIFIANMDEMPLYFDAVSKSTYEFRNTDTVKMKTTGKEKLRFTLVLCCLADGRKCDPMIIFKNLKKPPKPPKGIKWPKNVKIEAAKGGSMTQELMFKWMSSVWKERPNGFFSNFGMNEPNTLLIYDSARAHTTATVKANFRRYYGTDIGVVPGGMTPLIQPLDVAINYSVKRKFASLWKEWIAESERNFKETNIKSKVTYGLIIEWVAQVWREIDVDLIKTAFKTSGITTSGQRNEIDYHHKLIEIITNGCTDEPDDHSGLTDSDSDCESETEHV